MVCPNCNDFSIKPFCIHCGTATQPHNCGCGNNLTARQKFCEKCGAKCLPFVPMPPASLLKEVR